VPQKLQSQTRNKLSIDWSPWAKDKKTGPLHLSLNLFI